MIFLERELLELAYFLTTGEHLDVENITLCAGSRFRLGYVPDVGWGSGARGVFVGRCPPGSHGPVLRSRSVDSLPVKTRESVA